MKNKMFKRILAFILCAVTVFGASPAVFAAQAETDYLYNKNGDYWYVDDKSIIDETMSRDDVDENLNLALAMVNDRVFFMFEGEGRKWLINMIKGQYGFIFVGSEVGVYTAEENATSYGDFNFVEDSDMIDVQLECLWDKDADGNPDEIFSLPYEKHRYANILKKGHLTHYTDIGKELATKVKFGFNSEETAKSFVETVKKAHFTEAADESALVDDSFFAEDECVTLMWKSLNYNEFCKVYTFEKEEITLAPNESETLCVKYNGFTCVQPKIKWESSDESVVTVDQNGVVTAVGYGTARIYLKGGDCCAPSCEVTVEDYSLQCIIEKIRTELLDYILDLLCKYIIVCY